MKAVGLFIQMVNFEYVGPAAGGGNGYIVTSQNMTDN